MTIDEYQDAANATDRFSDAAPPEEPSVGRDIALFGLAGEVGTLLSEYKKFIRDGNRREFITDRVSEELGDVFWYATNVATKFGLRLDDVLRRNIVKVRDRWLGPEEGRVQYFDSAYQPHERLPRWFEASFSEVETPEGPRIQVLMNQGKQIGNVLSDNAHEDDGYRFHDAFHFAYAAILGWSPVLRRNLKVKRKSDKRMDEVEDGARAIIYEEAIAGLAFEYASQVNYYDGFNTVDAHLIDTIKQLTENLEVSVRTRNEWERAILEGFRIWRLLRANNGGVVRYDLETRRIDWIAPPRPPAE